METWKYSLVVCFFFLLYLLALIYIEATLAYKKHYKNKTIFPKYSNFYFTAKKKQLKLTIEFSVFDRVKSTRHYWQKTINPNQISLVNKILDVCHLTKFY